MHLILIAHFRPDIIGGAEYAMADMIRKTSSSEFAFTMLVPGPGSLAEFYKSKRMDVWVRMNQTPRRKYPGLHTVQSFFLARQLKRRNIHAVICNTFPAASRVGTACAMANIPYAIYVREYIADRPLHRRMLAKADRVFAVSRDVGDYLAAMADPSKIVVVHDSLDAQPILERAEDHRSSGDRRLSFGPGHPVVSIVGRITRYKQQDLFVKAIPEVLRRIPHARFAVIGSAQTRERAYEEKVKQTAVELNVADKVAFMGHRKDVVEIMTESTVCCLTSDREPFPRAILEAQAVGCPVVAANSGGCPEMVEDGVTGLLFPSTKPDSVKQLAERVVRLLDNEKLRNRLAREAKKNVLKTFACGAPVRHFEMQVISMVQFQ